MPKRKTAALRICKDFAYAESYLKLHSAGCRFAHGPWLLIDPRKPLGIRLWSHVDFLYRERYIAGWIIPSMYYKLPKTSIHVAHLELHHRDGAKS